MAEVAAGGELGREIERVADRLRVLGPRLAGSGTATSTLDRIRQTLQTLADLAAEAEGRPRRPVPALAPHGLGDQVLVLGHDLLELDDANARTSGLAALTALRRALP
jgi:hypothetical protein